MSLLAHLLSSLQFCIYFLGLIARSTAQSTGLPLIANVQLAGDQQKSFLFLLSTSFGISEEDPWSFDSSLLVLEHRNTSFIQQATPNCLWDISPDKATLFEQPSYHIGPPCSFAFPTSSQQTSRFSLITLVKKVFLNQPLFMRKTFPNLLSCKRVLKYGI